MKIAIFTDTYEPEINGVVTSIKKFTSILAGQGHEIMIFCPKYKGEKDINHGKIKVKRIYSFTFINNKDVRVAMPSLFSLISDLRKFGPDVVHIQTPMTLGATAIMAIKILRLKNIQTYHSYIPDMMVYLKPKSLPGVRKLFNNSANNLSVLKKLLESEVTVEKDFTFKITNKTRSGKMPSWILKRIDQKLTDKFAWNFTRSVYNRADLVLTPSEALKKELIKNGVKPRVEVLSNGIDLNYYAKKEDYSVQSRMIHVGRLGYEKNVDVLIKAFEKVLKKRPEMTFDIIGDGPARKSLEALVAKKKLKKKVRFLGFVEREFLQQCYRDYDFFITASTMETQGLVILEAMTAGLGAIGPKKLAVPELIINGKNGFLVKPFDVNDTAKKILAMYEREDRIREFGKESLKIAAPHDISKCSERLLKFYKKYANKKSSKKPVSV